MRLKNDSASLNRLCAHKHRKLWMGFSPSEDSYCRKRCLSYNPNFSCFWKSDGFVFTEYAEDTEVSHWVRYYFQETTLWSRAKCLCGATVVF